MKQSKGFTLVELLVVIAIIGLLSTLAVVSLGSARSKARDARRISDIKQIQTALELYFSDQGQYPVKALPALELGTAATDCLDATGFTTAALCTGTIYMGNVPENFATPVTTGYDYLSDGQVYTIDFALEGAVSGLAAGDHQATPTGIR
jgi:prepilin-type N-terminal cleavage/methylation domain-containing protein